MDKIKVIKTEKDYKDALEMVSALLATDPDPKSDEGERLSILTALIKDYESTLFPQALPDPVDAILFRMEQGNLKPRDLIPYIGSRSKVSEVLSRKRPLTLSMMRALEAGLGIPAKVLLKEPDAFRNNEEVDWSRFPIREMEKRHYFDGADLKTQSLKEVMEVFFRTVGSPAKLVGALRKSNYTGSSRKMDKYALMAWSGFIVKKMEGGKYPRKFQRGAVDLPLMQSLARLSSHQNGPILAGEALREIGIGLAIEPHFPQTYLDGATLTTLKDHPIIGLTLRHNRLDNFWFTLMHELAHVALHLDKNTDFFCDDLDNLDARSDMEKSADALAGEALIPEGKWESSPARLIPSPMAAESLAKELGIHTAIVAGRMRRENQRYQYLGTIVNQAEVRKYFPKIKWPK